MTVAWKLRALVVSSLMLGSAATVGGSSQSDNPFHFIFERNAFGLRPRQSAPPKPPPPPLPKVLLEGITTIFGDKRAVLKVKFPAVPPKPAKEESYILTEGQRSGAIKLLAINEKTETVKVDDCGTVLEVTFEPTRPPPATARPPLQPNWAQFRIRRIVPNR